MATLPSKLNGDCSVWEWSVGNVFVDMTSLLLQEVNSSKVSLSEIEKLEEVERLTAKQLKGILINNFVNYRGCKERHELISKVKMLWESHQANKRLYEQIVNQGGMYKIHVDVL